MLSCNMSDNDKVILFVIGKSKNPRSFKGFSRDRFCRYANNKTAWMTSSEFNSWLFDLNIRFKNEKRKVLLVLDNCPGHKITIETSNIEILFLPKNTTSKLQPLDAGIIRSFKAKFFSYRISSIVEKISKELRI
ncbi:Tigger transposable element-derived protein 6 [Dictyocoela muelleri]|nr:Tigger transposable element-derived protein 6 [Dictyocoela muelleri]